MHKNNDKAEKNMEKMFSFHQLAHWEAATLFEVSCVYRPGSGIASELFDSSQKQLLFLPWQDMVFTGWACTQPSSLFLPSEPGAWGSIKICRVHCRLRRLRTTAQQMLTVIHLSDPCGILCSGPWDMAWFSSASCLPQAGIISVVCPCYLSSP